MKEKTPLKKILNYVAFLVSMILSPYVTAAVFIVLIVYRYSESFTQFLPWMLTFFFFGIVIPGSYILWLMELKKINDIHIANQKDRRIPFIITGISSLAGAILLSVFGAARQVVLISMIWAANAIAIALITQAWKISVHMAMFSAVATITVVLFGWHMWWLYLLLIPLAWSRIYRKCHTLWQTTAGALLAFAITVLTFKIFGYI